MARIPEHEVERLKREVSVERLAEARGVELKRHGADLIGLCPFHDDHEPSLVITPAKNLWHCLGACQAGGSAIDWVMKAEGVSFRHAVELLRADHLPVAARVDRQPVKHATVREARRRPSSSDADDRELLGQVVGYYHETLKESPEALAYLEKRGLSSPGDRRPLPARLRQPHARLPPAGEEPQGRRRRSAAGSRSSGSCATAGTSTSTARWSSRSSTRRARSSEMYGRKITPNLRPGTPLHLYLPGPHRGVLNVEALDGSKEVILCEALIDALTFWCAGFRNVTASYGVEGFTHDHLAAFKGTAPSACSSPTTATRPATTRPRALAKKLIAEGIELLPRPVPEGDGRERVRAEGAAGGEEPRASLLGRARVDGQGHSAPEPRDLYSSRAGDRSRSCAAGASRRTAASTDHRRNSGAGSRRITPNRRTGPCR